MRQLRRLDLSKTVVDDEIVSTILSKLVNLEELNLSETRVTDRGLKLITRLPLLKKLWLRGLRQVSDSSVPELGAMKKIEDIETQGSNITSHGLDTLSVQLPHAEIHSRPNCSCHQHVRLN